MDIPPLTHQNTLRTYKSLFHLTGLWCLVWPTFIGGCRLDRVTSDTLVKTVDWETVDVHTEADPHALMPRLWGRLVKPRG